MDILRNNFQDSFIEVTVFILHEDGICSPQCTNVNEHVMVTLQQKYLEQINELYHVILLLHFLIS